VVTVQYLLREAPGFFGYTNGVVPQWTLGSAAVEDDGRFTVDVPYLSEDPFLQTEATMALIRVDETPPPWSGQPIARYLVSGAELSAHEPLLLDQKSPAAREQAVSRRQPEAHAA
jgi:hypothetical protein